MGDLALIPRPHALEEGGVTQRAGRVSAYGQCFLSVYRCHPYLPMPWVRPSATPESYTVFCELVNLKVDLGSFCLWMPGSVKALNECSCLLGLRLEKG